MRLSEWLMLVVAGGCGAAFAQPLPEPGPSVVSTPSAVRPVAAEIGGASLTLEEVQAALDHYRQRSAAAFATSEQRRALLEALARKRAVLEAARQEGLERDPEIVAAIEKMLLDRYLSRTLEAQLDSASVSDQEVRQFYETRQAEFLAPEQARVSIIFLRVSPKATLEARSQRETKAKEVWELARQAPDRRAYDAVVVGYSDHQASRYKGGDVGWLEKGGQQEWPQEVVDSAFSLAEAGHLAPLLSAPGGFYVVKLLEKRPPRVQPLEAVAGGIRHRLMLERRAQIEEAFYQGLFQKLGVKLHSEVLEGLTPPAVSQATPSVPLPPALPR